MEFAFDGDDKNVRDLLVRRQVYVDVCDSRGLTALHLATYNVHVNVIHTLLDFGANVNQLTDDALTSLSLAFLLYYGNNPQQTINTALEHADPILPQSYGAGRPASPTTNTNITDEHKSECEFELIPGQDLQRTSSSH
jgi:hypothetical protein